MDKEKEELENPEKEVKKVEKKEKKNKTSKEMESLKNELSTANEKILRLSAEMQNMRRRYDEERTKILKYDGESIILDFLPILDNFEHAVKMDDTNLMDEVSKFLSGFKMIYGNMVDVLKKFEITEIDALHKPFDENLMHAVLIDSTDEFPNNTVIDVLQKGYMYKDKVIRPVMVKVNNRGEENG